MNLLDEFFMGLRNVVHDIHTLSQSIHQGQSEMLKQISDLAASVASLQAQATVSAAKEDALIALAQSAVNGVTITQEDLDAVTAATTAVSGVTSGLAAEDVKADGALAPAAPSTPTAS